MLDNLVLAGHFIYVREKDGTLKRLMIMPVESKETPADFEAKGYVVKPFYMEAT